MACLLAGTSIPVVRWHTSGPMNWERGFDHGVFGRFDLAALAQPHLVCLFVPSH
jgi:hypothetical protein